MLSLITTLCALISDSVNVLHVFLSKINSPISSLAVVPALPSISIASALPDGSAEPVYAVPIDTFEILICSTGVFPSTILNVLSSGLSFLQAYLFSKSSLGNSLGAA